MGWGCQKLPGIFSPRGKPRKRLNLPEPVCPEKSARRAHCPLTAHTLGPDLRETPRIAGKTRWHGACDSGGVKLAFCLLFALVALGGCAAVPKNPAMVVADWAHQQGGEIVDARLDRLCSIGRTLPVDLVGVPLRF